MMTDFTLAYATVAQAVTEQGLRQEPEAVAAAQGLAWTAADETRWLREFTHCAECGAWITRWRGGSCAGCRSHRLAGYAFRTAADTRSHSGFPRI